MGETAMQNRAMKELNVGENFTGFCIVRKKELKQKKNGELYLKLEIGDKSGRLNGKVWQEAKELYAGLKVGQMIKIMGTIQSYKNTREIHIHRLRAARQQESERRGDLLPRSDKDIQKLKKLFMEHFHSIRQDKLSLLLKQIFEDESGLDKYLSLPSGKLWHHNYIYGNLEHLVCLLDMAEVLFCHYPFMKKELLKTAIILHNLGNLQQISLEGFIDYTTIGRLIGHPTLAFQRLNQEIESISDFPKELKMHLIHLILSQENVLEKTASVLPMTFEAIILNQMIQLDVLANATQRIIRNDRLPDSRWTKYNNLLQRFLYLGEMTENI
jgi:3'-5' exoribonuclease